MNWRLLGREVWCWLRTGHSWVHKRGSHYLRTCSRCGALGVDHKRMAED